MSDYAPVIQQALAQNQRIWLDVGCGNNKQKGAIGMDMRPNEGVDIVHDIRDLPLPIPDEMCFRILLSHLVEHINPEIILDMFDELWRIMMPHGQILIATPYAGTPRFHQDPTHIKGWIEVTPQYFDPAFPLWHVYRIKPWKIEMNAWEAFGDLNVIMSKRPADEDIEGLSPSPYQVQPEAGKTEILETESL